MYRRSNSAHMSEEDELKKRQSRSNSLHGADNIFNSSRNSSVFEELLQCGICYDRLFDSRMLPCQHTFCLSCLQRYVKTTETKKKKKGDIPLTANETQTTRIPVSLICPSCQKVVYDNFKFENLTNLPKNMYIDNLITVMEVESTSPTTKSPSLRCVKCQTMCPLPGKSCGHCMQIFCSVCFTKHLSTLKSNLSTLLEELLECESKLKTRTDVFNVECENIVNNIDKATQDHIKNLKEKQKNSLEEVENLKAIEKNNINELKDRIKEVSTEIKKLKFEDITNDDNKVNIFMNYHRATSKLLDDVSHNSNTQIHFDENTFKVTHSNQIYKDENNHILNTISENPFESIANMSIYYRENAFKTQLVWNKCPRPAGLGIPPWSPKYLYIATTTEKVVLIMDRSISKVIGKLSCPEMKYPQNIAFSENRLEVYVTDKWNNCIYVFNDEGEFLRRLCSAEELKSPDGIAVMHNNNLVVCDSGNDRVIILNPEDGEQVSLLAGTAGLTPFQAPTGVAVFEDKIIVCDTGNNSIKVYSSIGKLLRSFGTFGNRKAQFRTAEVVVCDPMGFIFVGDSGNGRIQIFTPDGTFLRDLTYQGKTSEKFLWISGLVISSQLEIIITDYKQKRLQIFNSYNKK